MPVDPFVAFVVVLPAPALLLWTSPSCLAAQSAVARHGRQRRALLLYGLFHGLGVDRRPLLLARGFERAVNLWNYGETTQMLAYPLWLSFVVVLPAIALLLWTCLYCLVAPSAVARHRQRRALPLTDDS